jgi:predicted dehydrogenase
MHRMVDNPDIDVVYVVTPNSLHLQYAQAAAKAGKHVFCEKPMEISVERCQQMIDSVKAANRMLGIGYRCQFEPHHLECMRLARTQEFGALKIIDAYFGFDSPPGVWRLNKALAGGGPLMDVGIYALQTSRYLTGEEPSWISATTTQGDPARFSEVEASVVWEAKFPSGVVARCGASFDAGPTGYFRALAEHGWFGLDPAYNYGGLRGMRSDGKAIDFPEDDQFAAEMDDFAQCILEKKSSKVPGEEGLRDVKILMAIYESARAGRPVELGKA